MTRVRWWWRFFRLPVLVLVALYVLMTVLGPAMAAGMLYYPQYGSPERPDGLKVIAGEGGSHLAVLYLPNPAAKFTVWFFHGNAEDLGDVAPFMQQLHDAGFAVFAYDYPGYGASDGFPSEKSLYAAGRRAREYLRRDLGVPAEHTLIYGRSLGGGPATQMATEEPIGGLILQSAFTSAFRVVTRWPLLPFDQYVNIRKLKNVHAPVLVMHGEIDDVIPYYHGRSLYATARQPKQALWIPGAHHNDFVQVAGQRLWTALAEFSATCAREKAGQAN